MNKLTEGLFKPLCHCSSLKPKRCNSIEKKGSLTWQRDSSVFVAVLAKGVGCVQDDGEKQNYVLK